MKTLFKSATAYRLLDPDKIGDLSALNDIPVADCAPGQLSRVGWENPHDREDGTKAYRMTNFGGREYAILCMVVTSKVLKPAAIRREVDIIAKQLEKDESRSVGRKERMQIKDDVIIKALPSALSEETRIYAYIDWQANMLVIDQHSIAKCDKFTSSLRDAIGSLPIVPMQAASMPEMVMSSWITNNSSPPDMELNGDAIFKNPTDLSQTARVHHVEINGAGVAGLLDDGMIPQEVSLCWHLSEASCIDFKVTDTVTLKSIKFSDELIDDGAEYEDAEQSYQASMIINCSTITRAIQECFRLFGGMSE